MAALLDFLGVRTIERTGAASSQAVVLGRADGSRNRPRTGHQPTSRQQNKAKSHPETEEVVGGVVVRGVSSLADLPLSGQVVKSASWCILLSGDEQRMWRQVGLWLLVIGLLGANLWTLGRPSEILMALHLSLYPIGG